MPSLMAQDFNPSKGRWIFVRLRPAGDPVEIYIIYLYVYVCACCLFTCVPHVWSAHGGQKKVTDSLELEL